MEGVSATRFTLLCEEGCMKLVQKYVLSLDAPWQVPLFKLTGELSLSTCPVMLAYLLIIF